jgi:hypothetical protein
VSVDTIPYIPPELLQRRKPVAETELTGYEDLFSVGQILLRLAGFEPAVGGYDIPAGVYVDQPLLGRIVEDLIDSDPAKRRLLARAGLGRLLDVNQRRQMYTDLRRELLDDIHVHSILAQVRPTFAPRLKQSGRNGLISLALITANALRSFPLMLGTLRKPFTFRKVARLKISSQSAAGGSFRYFAWWAFACLVGWSCVCSITVIYAVFDTLHISLFPAWYEIVRTKVVMFGYQPDHRVPRKSRHGG